MTKAVSEIDLTDDERMGPIVRALDAAGCRYITAGLFGAGAGEFLSIRFEFDFEALNTIKPLLAQWGYWVSDFETLHTGTVEVHWHG